MDESCSLLLQTVGHQECFFAVVNRIQAIDLRSSNPKFQLSVYNPITQPVELFLGHQAIQNKLQSSRSHFRVRHSAQHPASSVRSFVGRLSSWARSTHNLQFHQAINSNMHTEVSLYSATSDHFFGAAGTVSFTPALLLASLIF